jgi:hypothetical protein
MVSIVYVYYYSDELLITICCSDGCWNDANDSNSWSRWSLINTIDLNLSETCLISTSNSSSFNSIFYEIKTISTFLSSNVNTWEG